MRITTFLTILFVISFYPMQIAVSQEQKSTNDSVVYYSSLSDLLALNIYSSLRNNSMFISHKPTNTTLNLYPNSTVSLGGGIGYKGLALALGLGLPHSKSSIYKYGRTTSFDLRGSFSMKKFGGIGFIQVYKGYYNENPQDFMTWDKDYKPQIPELRTFSLGGLGYYVINNNKFSNKSAYSRSQKQNISAGSLVVGFFINYDEAESPSGFYPSEFPDSISGTLNLTGFRYFATGIYLGYTYTWVISKSVYFNAELSPGAGYKDVRVTSYEGEKDVKRNAHAQLAIRAVLGYESKYFYAGLTGSTLIRSIESNEYSIELATEQLRIYVGKRFNLGTR